MRIRVYLRTNKMPANADEPDVRTNKHVGRTWEAARECFVREMRTVGYGDGYAATDVLVYL